MKFNWLKFWNWFQVGAAVVASRSGKVRRYMGKIDNYLALIRSLEEMAKEQGGKALPFEDVRKEFGLNVYEAQELVRMFRTHSGMARAVSITGVPGGGQTERA